MPEVFSGKFILYLLYSYKHDSNFSFFASALLHVRVKIIKLWDVQTILLSLTLMLVTQMIFS
jgi:hypothetical protein